VQKAKSNAKNKVVDLPYRETG